MLSSHSFGCRVATAGSSEPKLRQMSSMIVSAIGPTHQLSSCSRMAAMRSSSVCSA